MQDLKNGLLNKRNIFEYKDFVEQHYVVVVVYSLNLKHGDFYNEMSIECNAMFI